MLRAARWPWPVPALGASVPLALLALLVAAPASRADSLPARAAHVADYDMRVRLDPEAKTLDGDAAHRLAQPLAGAGRRAVVPPLPERVQELEEHVLRGVGRPAARRPHGRRTAGAGWTSGPSAAPTASTSRPARPSSTPTTTTPTTGRSGACRCRSRCRPAASSRSTWPSRRSCPGSSRAPATSATTSSSASGSPSSASTSRPACAGARRAAGTATSSTPTRSSTPTSAATGSRSRCRSASWSGRPGSARDRRENPDGTSTHVFEQADVHRLRLDRLDPRFLEVKSTFSAEQDVTPQEYAETAKLLGRSLDEVRLSDVEVTVLLQPEHAVQAERHVEAAKAALKWFGLWYGRYPYPTITVVDPAFGAGGSGGMEYPTFITAGTSSLFNRWPFDRVLLPGGGHRPRVRPPVLAEHGGLERVRGVVARRGLQHLLDGQGHGRGPTAPGRCSSSACGSARATRPAAGNSVERMFDAIRTPAWGYSPGNYGFNSYQRTDLTLQTLESLLGAETMARVMRTYHERWRFRHPTSEDFYAVVAEVAGRDLRWFFDQAVERPGILDDEVASVRSERVQRAARRLRRRRGEDDGHHEGGAEEGARGRRGGRPAVALHHRREAARRGEAADVAVARVRGREVADHVAPGARLRGREDGDDAAPGRPEGGPALAGPLEADRAHGRAPSGLGHRRPARTGWRSTSTG